MYDDGSLVELAMPKDSQEIQVNDKLTNKNFKVKLSLEALEKLLQEGTLLKQTNGCFQAVESILRESENQGLLDELEALNTVTSLSNTEVVGETALVQRRRGRPRKGTYIPRTSKPNQPSTSSTLNNQNQYKLNNKRKSDRLLFDDSTDIEYHSETDRVSSGTKSKRRRQPKILNDYVTDFDSSDEGSKPVLHTTPSNNTKQRRGKGKSRAPYTSHSIENDDILSYYLGDFDKKFSEQDIFDEKFLDDMHASNEDENTNLDAKVSGGPHVSEKEDTLASLTTNTKIKSKSNSNINTASLPKRRDRKSSKSAHFPQVAPLQQRYSRLLHMLQKKPQYNKVIDLVHGASKLLNEEQLVFFTVQLKSGSKNLQGVRFSAREKVLALAIYAHSPETYKWMQSIFHLPTKLILDRWLESIAKNSPDTAKKLIYYIYNKYIFKS